MRSTPGDVPVWDVFTCYSSHMFAGCYVCTSYVCIIPNSCFFNNHIYYQKAVIKVTNTKKGGKEIPATEDSTEIRISLIMLMLMLIIIISHLGITWSPRLCSQGDYETEGEGKGGSVWDEAPSTSKLCSHPRAAPTLCRHFFALPRRISEGLISLVGRLNLVSADNDVPSLLFFLAMESKQSFVD